MVRSSIGALGLVAPLLINYPAHADAWCNYQDIAKMQDSMGQMTEASRKDAAAAEIVGARAAMTRSDNRGCAAHVERFQQITR